MRVPGRISPAKAAEMLGLHHNTVLAWCKAAIEGRPSKLSDVEQYINGYYWISLKEVKLLRTRFPKRSKTGQD